MLSLDSTGCELPGPLQIPLASVSQSAQLIENSSFLFLDKQFPL
jgi:hypothetical protein